MKRRATNPVGAVSMKFFVHLEIFATTTTIGALLLFYVQDVFALIALPLMWDVVS